MRTRIYIHLQIMLSKYSFLAGDKIEALRLMEEVVSLTEYDKGSYFSCIQLKTCAYLNLACNNRLCCIEQLRKAIDINAVIFGRDDGLVEQGNNILTELLEGAYTSAQYLSTTDSVWLELA